MKTEIPVAIGKIGLQPPASLDAGLPANDGVKYARSLLRMAIDHAEHRKRPTELLKQERIGCRIDDPGLDTAVGEAPMFDKPCRVPVPLRFQAQR